MQKLKSKLIIFLGIAFVGGFLVWFGFRWGDNNPQIFGLEMPATYAEAMKVQIGGDNFLVKPVNANDVVREDVNGEGAKKIKYIGAYANTDVVQTIYATKIKEDIILQSVGHPEEFAFELNLEEFIYDVDEQGNINIKSKVKSKKSKVNETPSEFDKILTIPAPYMIDANGVESEREDVVVLISGNILTLKPNAEWLSSHQYPIILDPTIELSVLNLYSHPLLGDDWEVSFTTMGTADLYIIPNDPATVADDEFVSLWCGDTQIFPSGEGCPEGGVCYGDEIYVKDWSCSEVAKVIHNTKKAGDHTLRFQFGDEISYAYNHFTGDRKYAWGENVGWINASSTDEILSVTSGGVTGYAWGENVGWINFDYDGVAGATNTTATDWGVTNDGEGNLGGYAWGENIGWINFNSSSTQVTIDPNTGDFEGYAWGENVGWVNFGHNLSNYVMRYDGAPFVKTNSASNIASGVVTANAYAGRMGFDISERGFKYGLTETDTWTVSQTGNFVTGDFKLVVENLTPDTTYYIRAYAINSDGTAYGDYVQFTTEATHKNSPVIFKRGVILKESVKVK